MRFTALPFETSAEKMFSIENAIVFIPLIVVLLIFLVLCAIWKRSKVVDVDHTAMFKPFNKRQGEYDRRRGIERRSGKDRRKGRERRIFSD
jgi:hypothetical protein